MKKGTVYILLLIFILAFIALCGMFLADCGNNAKKFNEDSTGSELVNSQNTDSFYLLYDGEKVVIYREKDRSIYDYADINIEELPPEIREQIKLGLYIDGEENLYDFLQTYSS